MTEKFGGLIAPRYARAEGRAAHGIAGRPGWWRLPDYRLATSSFARSFEMGGKSETTQQSSQQSQLTPWGAATPGLQGILSGLDPSIANMGGTPQTNAAFRGCLSSSSSFRHRRRSGASELTRAS
jgi:hypothetical protein